MMKTYDMVYMDFYVRRIDILMSLDGTEHVYTITTGLHLRMFNYGFLVRCTCMFVYEYNWDIWYTYMYDIDGLICVCFQAGGWNIYIYSQLSSMISCIYEMSVFTSSTTNPFYKKSVNPQYSCYCKHMVEKKKKCQLNANT